MKHNPGKKNMATFLVMIYASYAINSMAWLASKNTKYEHCIIFASYCSLLPCMSVVRLCLTRLDSCLFITFSARTLTPNLQEAFCELPR